MTNRRGGAQPPRRLLCRPALVAAAGGVALLAHLDDRAFRTQILTTTDDPRVAVMGAVSAQLFRAYRAVFVLVLAVTGARWSRAAINAGRTRNV